MRIFDWTNPSGGDWFDPANWSTGSVPSAGDAVVIPALAESATISLDQTLSVASLTVSGGTLALGAGTTLAVTDALLLQGTIAGGTLDTTGADVSFAGGTLRGVTYLAPLDLSAVANGSLHLADGASSGLILDSGQYDRLLLDGTQVLNHTTIALGSIWSDNVDIYDTGSGAVLTLGPDATIQQTGNGQIDNYNGTPADGFVNEGTIQAADGGYALTIDPAMFQNEGLLRSANGATLNIDQNSAQSWTNTATGTIESTDATLNLGGAFTNDGTITASGGSLDLGSGAVWSNAGLVTATDSAINLGGTVTTAGLGDIQRIGGSVTLTGTLNNAGGTIDATQGAFAGLTLGGGTIVGGTQIDGAGVGVTATNSSANRLSGVTVLGGLSLTSGYLALSAGSQVLTADGSAPGDVTLNNASLELDSVGTFASNVTLINGAIYFAEGAVAADQPIVATGLDASGAPLPGGSADPSWILNTTDSPAVVLSAGNLIGGWQADTAASGWIDVQDSAYQPAAPYSFTQTFTVAAGQLATSAMVGTWYIDDNGTLSLNGSVIDSAGGDYYGRPFTLSAADGLVAGTNTLTLTMTSSDQYYDAVRLSATLQSPDVIAPGAVIAGSGTVGDNPDGRGIAIIDNQGTIDADLSGQALTVDPTGLLNDGLLQAQNGGTLLIDWNQSNAWTNDADGTIAESGATLDLGGTFDNAGTIATSGGVLDLGNGSAWTNSGVVDASGTAIRLAGTVTQASVGDIQRSLGSLALIGTLMNAGGTLDVTQGSFAGLTLDGGTIAAGTLIQGAGGTLGVTANSGNVLSGVTVLGGLSLGNGYLALSNGSSVLTADGSAQGGITLTNASLELDNAGTMANDVTLSGGSLYFAGAALAAEQPIVASALIAGSGSVGDNPYGRGIAAVDNQGTIDADLSGQPLDVDPTIFQNDGLLEAGSGGTLQVEWNQANAWNNASGGTVTATAATVELGGLFGNAGLIAVQGGALDAGQNGYGWSNSGTIEATDATVAIYGPFSNSGVISQQGGTLDLGQNGYTWSNTGAIAASNATVVLAGEMSAGDTIQGTGDQVTVNGVLDLGGGTINTTAGALAGLLIDGGTIANGTLIDGMGTGLRVSGNTGNELLSDTVQGGLDLTGGVLTVDGGMIDGGVAEQGGYLVLTDGAEQSGAIEVSGGGALELRAATDVTTNVTLAGATLELTFSPSGTVAIDPGVLVDGFGTVSDETYSTYKNGWWWASSPQAVDNQGTIAADAAGQNLTISPSYFTNDGLMTASQGASLTIQGPSWYDYYQSYTPAWSNAADGAISGSNATVALYGSFTNAGLINIAGGTLDLGQIGDTWSNTGTIDATGASVVLSGSFLNAAVLGTVNRTGGSVALATSFDNTGGTIDLGGGIFQGLTLAGGAISNGTVLGGDLTVTYANGNELSGVTVAGNLNVGGGDLTLDPGVVVTGILTVLGGVSLELTGSLLPASAIRLDGGNLYASASGSGTITVGAGQVIDGAGGISGYGGFYPWYYYSGDGLANDGSIIADQAGSELTVQSNGALVNDRLIGASNDGDLVIYAAVTGTADDGTISVATHGQVALEGGVDATQTLLFQDSTGAVFLEQPQVFGGTIAGFQAGDALTLTGIQGAASAAWDGSTGLLSVYDGQNDLLWSGALSGDYTGATFGVSETFGTTPYNWYSWQATLTVSQPADFTPVWTGADGTDWEDPANWSSGVLPDGGDATIAAPGALAVIGATETVSIDSVSLAANQGVLSVQGTLLVGGTLDIQAGQLLVAGDIAGGTLVTVPDGVMALGGTLDTVTVLGELQVNGGTLTINNPFLGSLTVAQGAEAVLTGAVTASPLTVALNGGTLADQTGSQLDVTGFGAVADVPSGAVLLDNTGTLDADSAGLILSVTVASFQNDGLAEATNGATLSFGAAALLNNGTVQAGPGSTIVLGEGFSNTGLISATDATLDLGTAGQTWTNTGTIFVTDSVLNLGGDETLADIGTIVSNNSTIVLNGGTLDLAGGTLGGNEAGFTLDNETVTDGSIDATALAPSFSGYGTNVFDGVALTGTLLLSGDATVEFTNGTAGDDVVAFGGASLQVTQPDLTTNVSLAGGNLTFLGGDLPDGAVNASDTFNPVSLPWQNGTGDWTAANGAYYAQYPSNAPAAASDLPYDLTDLSLTVTVNNLGDGGIWLHSDGSDQNGILLVLGGDGYGQGARDGWAGTAAYWQTVSDGNFSGEYSVDPYAFVPGGTYTVTVTAVGSTYTAWLDPDGVFDGASTELTSFYTSQFGSGQVGLYDDQPDVSGGYGPATSFSNFSLVSLSPTRFAIDPGIVVQGGGAVGDNAYGNAPADLDNNGTIDADLKNLALNVTTSGFANDGLAEATNGGTLDIEDGTSVAWSNNADGTIVASGATVNLGGAFTNAGDITAINGTLQFGDSGAWANIGTISLANTALTLNGALTQASLGNLTRIGGSMALAGTLDNTGGTLDLTQGMFQGLQLNGGTIAGGTVLDNGQGLTLPEYASAVLSGVTYEGTLDLAPTYDVTLHLANGTKFTGAGGSGAGTVLLTGGYDTLMLDGTQVLDNATISIGATSGYWWSTNTILNDGRGPLTLGPNLLLQQAIGYVQLGSYGVGAVINQGTIDAWTGSDFQVYGVSFDNQATIAVATGDRFAIQSGTVTNEGSIAVTTGGNLVVINGLASSGTISVNGGSAIILASFTNDGSVAVNGGLLDLATGLPAGSGQISLTSTGTLELGGTVTTADLAAIDTQGGTVEIDGVLDNTGATLAVGGTAAIGTLLLNGGTVLGGTLQDAGGAVETTGNSGTLDGVTFEGTLNLTAGYNVSLHLADGTTLTGTEGTGPGSALLNGQYDYLLVDGTQTLDDATVSIGDPSTWWTWDYLDSYDTGNGAVLTLGPNLLLQTTGGNAQLGSYNGGSGDGIVNQGTIDALVGGTFQIAGPSFDNQGTIAVANGASAVILAAVVSNEGTITVGLSGQLEVQQQLTNAGEIVVSAGRLQLDNGVIGGGAITVTAGGVLALQGSVTPAALSQIVSSNGGTVEIDGVLDLTGTMLAIGDGTPTGALALNNGTILNGVVQDFGNGLQPSGSYWNVLDGVTYEGTLTQSGGYLHIQNGSDFAVIGGTGPGAIAVSGNGAHFIVDGNQTLDNATVSIGGGNWWDYLESYDGNGSATLTLGPNLTIQQTGYYAQIDDTSGYGGSQIVNQGLIQAGTAGIYGAQFRIYGPSFDNQGSVIAGYGAWLYADSGSFSNDGSVTVTGNARLEVQNLFTNNATVLIQQGELQLDSGVTGAGVIATAFGGTIYLPNGASVPQIEALQAASQGDILINGFFDNSGTTLLISSGTVEFQNALTNNGSIVVDGGTLRLDSNLYGSRQVTVTGTGVLEIGSNLFELGSTTLGGTLVAAGGALALTGVYSDAAGETDTVTFQGAQFGWYGDGYATLAGPGTLVSNGVVYVTDWYSGAVQLLLTGGVTWQNSGTVYDQDVVQLGAQAGDAATIVNQAGALFDLNTGDARVTADGAGTYRFINAGTLLQNRGGNDYVTAPLLNTGLVETTNGFLEIGSATLGGTFAAAGGNLVLVGTYAAAAGTTDSVTFQGAQFGWFTDGDAVLAGPGTLASSGYVYVHDWGGGEVQLLLTGGITWQNYGTVYDQDIVQLGSAAGDAATIVNQVGALFDLNTGDARVTADGAGTYSFVNQGTLLQDRGGNDYVTAPLLNTGLVETTNGFLEIGSATLGGTFAAAGGNLVLVGSYAVGASVTDSVTFQGAQFGWFTDGDAVLAGPGTLASNGYVYVHDWGGGEVQLMLTGGVTWQNAGTVYDQDVVQLGTAAGDAATIVNEAGALFDLSSGDGRITADGAGTYSFVNQGTLLQDRGGNDYVTAPLLNTGLVETTNGFLEIGSATLGGTFAAAGGNLVLVGTYAAAAGTTDSVTFQGAQFGWYTDGYAVLAGPGTLASNGYAYVHDWGGGQVQLLLTGGVTWQNAGTVYDRDLVQFGTAAGDAATIVNQAGALFDLNSGDARITADGAGTYSFVNDGTLLQDAGGYDSIGVAVDNLGTITDANGNLYFDAGGSFAGAVNGGGGVYFEGGTYDISGTVAPGYLQVDAGTVDMQGGTIAAGGLYFASGVTVTGYGSVAGLQNNGLIDASGGNLVVTGNVSGSGAFQIEANATLELTGSAAQQATFNGTGATLKLDNQAGYTGTLLNFGKGDKLDLANEIVSSASIVGGTIIANLAGGGTIRFTSPAAASGLQFVLNSDGSGGTTLGLVSANIDAVPQILTPLGVANAIALPDAHVSATANDRTTLAIENAATAPADGLNATIRAFTGAAYGSGTIASLGAGLTDSSSLSVGLNNTSAGAKSGSALVSFSTDGAQSGIPGVLPGQTLSLTGNVYRLAQAAVAEPGNDPIVHVGDNGGTVSVAIQVSNSAAADGYSEGLDASVIGVNADAVALSQLSLVGAARLNGADVQLTAASGEAGAAWMATSIAGGESFDSAFTFSLRTIGGTPQADGLAFVIQGDGTGAIGGGGGDIGLSGLPGHSAAIVFQSWANNRAGIVLNGDPYSAPDSIPLGYAGTVIGTADVAYDASAQTLTLTSTETLDGASYTVDQTVSVDLATYVGQNLTLGFTAGTGGSDSDQEVTAWNLSTGSASQPVSGGTAQGSTGDLAAGQTAAGALSATFSTDTAGTQFAAVQVAETSDGTGVDTLGLTNLGTVSTAVEATVLNYATATVVKTGGQGVLSGGGGTYTIDLGRVGAGSAAVTVDLGVENVAQALSDSLQGSFTAGGDPEITVTANSFSNIGAGGTASNAVVATLSTGTVGVFTDTVVLAPTGTNASGYSGALQAETITLTGTVTINPAEPLLDTASPVDFGAVRQNSIVAPTDISVSNIAAAPAETLDVAATASGEATATGAIAGLPGGSTDDTSITAGLLTTTPGVATGDVAFSFSSGGTAISSADLLVTGTVFALAAPSVTGTTLNLGAARVGGSATPQSVSIANGSTADPFQESLAYGLQAAPLGYAVTNGQGTIQSGGSASPSISLSTATAGSFTNETETLTLTSTGAGTSGLADTALGSETITLNGKVYAAAVAVESAASLNFGIVHAGATDIQALSLTNTATGALTDVLTGGIATISGGGFSGSGTLGAGIAAGGSSSALSFALNTGTSGVFNATATLALASHDADQADVAVAVAPIALNGTVYNYATVGVTDTNAGKLTGSGNAYVLNLGTITLGATVTAAVLDIANIALGLADTLSGTVAVSGGTSAFVDSGFGSIGTLSAGQTSGQIDIAIRSGTLGVYTETVTLTPVSGDSAGSTALAPVTIAVTGTVAEPPGAVYNLTAGADTVNGNGGANTIVATGGALSAGDSINAGSGPTNILSLKGAGTFDLSQPATLTGISTVWAQEGQASAVVNGATLASTLQTVTLRAAENNVAVNVQPAAPNPANPAPTAITINGAANNDVINLGYGNDTVTPGVGETVNGGSGNATVTVTAATISDAINGGSGTTKLWFTGGGTFALGANLANLTSVYLAPASTAWNVTATATPGLVLQDGDTANSDHLTANGAVQVLTGGGAGKLTMQGAFDTVFQDSAALFNGDTLGLSAGDVIDITGLAYAASGPNQTAIGFTENSQHTGGSLTVSAGGLQKTAMTLTGGIFNQGSFTIGSDNAGGTLLRYHA